MSLCPEQALARARALRERGHALPPDGLPADEIVDSWVRCLDAGLASGSAPQIPVVEEGELRERRERAEFVRRLAQAELETLSQQIAGSNFLLAFADPEGVILDCYADNRFRMSGSGAGIVAGSLWRESNAGTNGLGTALATGRSVAVTGLEHFFLELGDVSCTATPVRDAHGAVVGVLDASSYFESRQRHTQALVQMAATHIENGLLAHQMRGRWVLAIHPRPEFLNTLSAGLLAFDDGGALLAANLRARQLLQGLDATPGTAFEALFGEPFALFAARAERQGEQRLRDVMGSSLVAACVGRPRRASTATPLPRPVAAAPAPVPEAASAAPADDPAVADAYRLAESAARLGVPILIHGETGTGKEVLARHVHASSGRGGAFVAVNCGALPAELVEAELFGYVGGAFTGARREGSEGLIAGAHGGTLLLDELAELPLPLQAALLRFLDDRQVRPVGGTRSRAVDVQLLAATHTDLDAAVTAGRFRPDLLYRLNTVAVRLPPLRARRDFAAAARQLLGQVDRAASLDETALARLARHPWPGNFRELRAVLTRALLLAGPGRRLGAAEIERVMPAAPVTAASSLQQAAGDTVRREFERCGGSVSRTARVLGISRTTVYRYLREGAAAAVSGR